MELKLYRLQRPYPCYGLLIVPYGIETTQRKRNTEYCELLIVPYGIETALNSCSNKHKQTFNRTLWN